MNDFTGSFRIVVSDVVEPQGEQIEDIVGLNELLVAVIVQLTDEVV